jgi:hypothetical protein
MNIWIGSNCLSAKNYSYLIDSIRSVITQQWPARLVLSIYSTQNLDNLFNLLITSRIDFAVIEQPESLTQFEHFRELIYCDKLEDNSWVMFLDDDDLLLPQATSFMVDHIDGFIGYQYIPCDYSGKAIAGNDLVTIDTVQDYIDHTSMEIGRAHV